MAYTDEQLRNEKNPLSVNGEKLAKMLKLQGK